MHSNLSRSFFKNSLLLECTCYSLSFFQISKRLFLITFEYVTLKKILKKNLFKIMLDVFDNFTSFLSLLFSGSLFSFIRFFSRRRLHCNFFIFGKKNNTALNLYGLTNDRWFFLEWVAKFLRKLWFSKVKKNGLLIVFVNNNQQRTETVSVQRLLKSID